MNQTNYYVKRVYDVKEAMGTPVDYLPTIPTEAGLKLEKEGIKLYTDENGLLRAVPTDPKVVKATLACIKNAVLPKKEEEAVNTDPDRLVISTLACE